MTSSNFTPVKISSLRWDTLVSFDIYVRYSNEKTPVLYRERNQPLSREALERLLDHRVETVYISSDQDYAYQLYMEENVRGALTGANLNEDEKSEILYSTSVEMVQQFLLDPEDSRIVSRTKNMVSATVDVLLSREITLSSFLRSASLDYNTYTHSVDVTMYALYLGQQLGFEEPQFLRELGEGAFLHDLGKSLMPHSILKKNGKLTDEEWEIMRKHAQWGYELLLKHGVTSDVVLSITRDHHEKLDGSGYGRGLHADDLPIPVRMVTICDIFDALTTKRPYKERMGSFPSLEIMKQEFKGKIDPDMFDEFVRMLAV